MRPSLFIIAALATMALGKTHAFATSLRDMKKAASGMNKAVTVWSDVNVRVPIRRQSRALSKTFNRAAKAARKDLARAAKRRGMAAVPLEMVRIVAREAKGLATLLRYVAKKEPAGHFQGIG
ncbi:hypothetical protein JDV02_001937 [Purpureocillium takamizusanense]|uniref:Uncharacterized protein n=1 Tax=Purpureocillium takamizusanense TaxID=2060973 RepID=A0A9Q8Q9X2_9HYPO|nr:uncharacterized protein JDV02_001937 [Purpureocillium takamizusanense]UNI15402.1 hypothetical protein JDV02_001937 [Purpureocillium takamizusanense]